MQSKCDPRSANRLQPVQRSLMVPAICRSSCGATAAASKFVRHSANTVPWFMGNLYSNFPGSASTLREKEQSTSQNNRKFSLCLARGAGKSWGRGLGERGRFEKLILYAISSRNIQHQGKLNFLPTMHFTGESLMELNYQRKSIRVSKTIPVRWIIVSEAFRFIKNKVWLQLNIISSEYTVKWKFWWKPVIGSFKNNVTLSAIWM